MNIANGSAKVEKPSPHVSIFNFHYATPPDAVAANAHLRGVIGENETGFRGRDDVLYRTEGWAFVLAGGGLYNNLDYSFTAAHPDGTFLEYTSPGGGSPALRRQLGLLKDFIDSFDFVRMRPRPLGRQRAGGARGAGARRAGPTVRRLPARTAGGGGFSVRWTGRLTAPASGRYRLTTVSDDGIRVSVGGQRLIENWTDHGPAEDSGDLELTAGQAVELRVEFYQAAGAAVARLKWTRPDGTSEVVPASAFSLPDGSGAGLAAEYFDGRGFDGSPGLVRTDPALDFEWEAMARPVPRRTIATGPSSWRSSCRRAATARSGSIRGRASAPNR